MPRATDKINPPRIALLAFFITANVYLQICSIAVLYIWQLTKRHVVAIATNTFPSTVTRRPTP